MKLFVAGLPYDLDDAELEEIFEKFGTVNSAKVALDKETGKSRGFGFVDMPDRTEAKDAMDSLNEISLGKKPLVIKEAEERSGPPSGNRGGGGGYNSGGGGGGGYRGGGGGNSGGGGYRGGGSGGGNDRDRNRY
jgi:cold-inducible RNA-binding protein